MLNLPIPILIEESIVFLGKPMLLKTYDASTLLEVQAEPDDITVFFKFLIKISEFIPGIEIFKYLVHLNLAKNNILPSTLQYIPSITASNRPDKNGANLELVFPNL